MFVDPYASISIIFFLNNINLFNIKKNYNLISNITVPLRLWNVLIYSIELHLIKTTIFSPESNEISL